jgi:23S rRNA pseudoU1915 N3-methylase RlmH
MKINLIAVGKVKEKYFSDGISEYVKRLSRFCDFSLIEIPEENYKKVDDSLILNIKKGNIMLPFNIICQSDIYRQEHLQELLV